MRKSVLYTLIAFLSLGLFTACEKVIDVEPGPRHLVLNGVPSEGRRAFVNFLVFRRDFGLSVNQRR